MPLEDLTVGLQVGPSSWILVDQARIDQFGTATEDMQWLHADPVRAAESRFGSTIAHGWLLSHSSHPRCSNCCRWRAAP